MRSSAIFLALLLAAPVLAQQPAAVLSTHPDFQGKNVPASRIDARPNFQLILYPGWTSGPDGKVNPSLQPQVPPTFLLQAAC
jgi:hypothetical protein